MRAARIAAGHGAQDARRRGKPHRRHLCHPRVRAEEALRLRQPLRRRLPRRRGVRLERRRAHFDWPALVRAKDKEISRLSDAYRENLARSGRQARSRSGRSSSVRIRCAWPAGRRFPPVISSSPAARVRAAGGVEGLEHAITSNEIFDLAGLPRRLLVVGGGYIAIEFAALFPAARLSGHRRSCARPNFCAASTTTCATACATRWLAPASFSASARCRPASKSARRLAPRDALGRRRRGSRPGADRDRPPARHPGGLASRPPASSSARARRGHGRRESDQQRAVDPCDRRRHPPGRSHPGRHSRRTCAGRPAVREGAPPIRYDTIASTVFGTPELGAVGLTESEALERFPSVHVFKTDFRPLKATVSGGPSARS